MRTTATGSRSPTATAWTGFAVDDDLSYTEVVFDDGAGKTITQRIRKLRFNVQGQLVADNNISRSIEDIITVRNDLLY